MSKRIMTGLLLVVMAAASWLSAADQTPKIPSKVVEKQVKKLTTKVHWCDSLEEAEAKAKRENKLVLWLHALGDLDGTT
jgi:hypothetical protein